MAYPRKLRGFRSITVDALKYRWRFDDGVRGAWVTLQGGASGGQQAEVFFSDVPEVRPIALRPAHAARCIRLALSRGWRSQVAGPLFRIQVSWDCEIDSIQRLSPLQRAMISVAGQKEREKDAETQ